MAGPGVTAAEARERIRRGEHTGPTAGLAPGHAQANLVVLPEEHALDFFRFCIRNPKPCPLLEVTEAGSPVPRTLAPEADLRTDVPKYRVYEVGELVDEPAEIRDYWRGDLVCFLLGCSFTFEAALLAAGLRLAHLDQGRNVPMYVTNRECVPSGPFRGPLVVSMRPYRPEEVPRAVSITARYPMMHGAPVWVGDPEALGIRDLDRPDFGDAISIGEGEIPVFWACGVTPQAAALEAGLPLVITHSPGHMFITDRRDAEYAL
ncbi:Putative hydro-lyase [Rubrobacter xylanophilus DSM 9941]|uniref:putative hydro-lyase n=1 Tax=Rubrobacter xylanophilus TaxID=49319 RepID=UPI001C644372|nr:putative hydro-lyase [Rubrobacter xylanophilus]QYJ15403.1 Putative hydro-lyase [Rubrobacter xylanophilus DSM 9941]